MAQLQLLVPPGQQESLGLRGHPIQESLGLREPPIQESLGPLGRPIQESPGQLGHHIQESQGQLGHPIQGPQAPRVAAHLYSSAYRPAPERRFSIRWATTRFSSAS
jgi:hypothetical protein